MVRPILPVGAHRVVLCRRIGLAGEASAPSRRRFLDGNSGLRIPLHRFIIRMCGRYTLSQAERLAAIYERREMEFAARYNVSPTQEMPIILAESPETSDHLFTHEDLQGTLPAHRQRSFAHSISQFASQGCCATSRANKAIPR